MATKGSTNKIVVLSKEQYQTLVNEGTITVGGETITYSEYDLYLTPAKSELTEEELAALNSGITQAKVGRMLLCPMSAPAVQKIVTVDTNNSQKLEDFKPLYLHSASFTYSGGAAGEILFEIKFLSNSSEPANYVGDINANNITYQKFIHNGSDCLGNFSEARDDYSTYYNFIVLVGSVIITSSVPVNTAVTDSVVRIA